MKTIEKQTGLVRTVLDRLSHRQAQGGTVRVSASETEVDQAPAYSEQGRQVSQEPEAITRGVIRREEVPLLARYGTSYGLFDEWTADYNCVLKSDAYRLGEYVGDSVWVSGPLAGVIGGMPVREVTHLELLKLEWMR